MGNKASSLSRPCYNCSQTVVNTDTSLQKLEDLLRSHEGCLPSPYHQECLQISVLHGHAQQLREVLKCGANPNMKWKTSTEDIKGYSEGTALHVTTSLGNREKVNILLEHGADINVKNIYGETALHIAASMGDLPILRLLLLQGKVLKCLNDKSKRRLRDCDIRKHVHRTALHLAAACRKPRCAQLLLDHGAKLGDAALACCSLANKEDDVQLIRSIINTGYSVNQHRGYAKYTMLHDASVLGKPDIVLALLASGAKVNAVDRFRQIPLTHAIIQEHTLVAKILIDANSDVNMADRGGRVPLHHAALRSDPSLVTTLLDHGAETDIREKTSMMPHHICLFSTRAQCKSLHTFLMNGCPMDALSEEGNALTIAYTIQTKIKGPIQPCLALLFSHGAKDDVILLQLASVYENGVDYSWFPALYQLIIHSGNDNADLSQMTAKIEQWFFAVDHKYYPYLLECRRGVLSLKEHARIAIRRQFRRIRKGKSIWPCIEQSRLPTPLQYYLKLLDVCGENLLDEIS